MSDIKNLETRLSEIRKAKTAIQQKEMEYKIQIKSLKETIKEDLQKLQELGYEVQNDEDIINLHKSLEENIVTFLDAAESKLQIST